jgi:hypothetical protein
VRDNPVKAKLKRGETAIGTMLFEFFVPGIDAVRQLVWPA